MKQTTLILIICVICAATMMGGCIGNKEIGEIADYTNSVAVNARDTSYGSDGAGSKYTIYSDVVYSDNKQCYDGICAEITDIRVTGAIHDHGNKGSGRICMEVDVNNTGTSIGRFGFKIHKSTEPYGDGLRYGMLTGTRYEPPAIGETATFCIYVNSDYIVCDRKYDWVVSLTCVTDTAHGYAFMHSASMETYLGCGEAQDHLKLPVTADMFPITSTHAAEFYLVDDKPLYTCVLNGDGSVDMDYFYGGGNPTWEIQSSEVYKQSFNITYDGGMMQVLTLRKDGNATMTTCRKNKVTNRHPGIWDW